MIGYSSFGGGFGGGFEIMFFLVFAIVIGTFIFSFISGISQWNKNNQSPRLTVESTIVTKRADTSLHHHHANDIHHTTRSTTYYVTFEVESGDRIELEVNGTEYGMLVEGDYGKLSFQGTRYLGFERIV